MENMSGIMFWGNTEATNTPRALYIGDSVSCVTRNRVTAAEANNVLLFDGIGASKAVERLILVPTRFSQVLARCMLPSTDEILAGLGKMYVADERFKKSIDKYGDGTAEFAAEAIEAYCRKV